MLPWRGPGARRQECRAGEREEDRECSSFHPCCKLHPFAKEQHNRVLNEMIVVGLNEWPPKDMSMS